MSDTEKDTNSIKDKAKKLFSDDLKVNKAASIKSAIEYSLRSEKTDKNGPKSADAPAEKKIRTNKVSSPKAKVTVADKSSVSAILTRKEPEPAVKEEPAKAEAEAPSDK